MSLLRNLLKINKFLFMRNTDSFQIEGLRVVVWQNDDGWMAQGLEIDYAAGGVSIEDVAKAFVSLFNRASSNPHGAQPIFSTHDVTLLGGGLIQQDEIRMTDKDRDGVSRFTPLTEFRLRSRDDIEKAYRTGRLGGVPSADDFYLEFSRGASPTAQ